MAKKVSIQKKAKKLETAIKKEVKENLFNVPNTLTVSRIFFAFIAIYMLFSNVPLIWVAVVFGIAAITDFFDGYLARKLKQTTSIGARLDQIVDRIFTVIVVIALAIYILNKDQNILLLILVSSREIIGLPGVIIRLLKKKATYQVKYIGKVTTFVQSVTIAFLIAFYNSIWILPLVGITFVIGILSGFDYLKESVK